MVGDKSIERDIGHVGVGFQFGEDIFLRTSSIVKFDDLSRAGCLIGEDNLVGKAKLHGWLREVWKSDRPRNPRRSSISPL